MYLFIFCFANHFWMPLEDCLAAFRQAMHLCCREEDVSAPAFSVVASSFYARAHTHAPLTHTHTLTGKVVVSHNVGAGRTQQRENERHGHARAVLAVGAVHQNGVIFPVRAHAQHATDLSPAVFFKKKQKTRERERERGGFRCVNKATRFLDVSFRLFFFQRTQTCFEGWSCRAQKDPCSRDGQIWFRAHEPWPAETRARPQTVPRHGPARPTTANPAARCGPSPAVTRFVYLFFKEDNDGREE